MTRATWYKQLLFTLLFVGLAPHAHAQAAEGTAATEEAVFGGGCFWCMEEAFEKIKGVKTVESGYTGGKNPSPTYEQVSRGNSGHVEVIRVKYDPAQVNYASLLKQFWANIDPTVENRQFCDSGEQYRSAIYYLNPKQQQLARQSRDELQASGRFKKIFTTIEPGQTFYVAEEYHQDFYKKNPLRYQYYKTSCGREKRLKEVWGERPQ
jgi:peptide-methionine (S)-S-oxide reductase